MEKAKVYFTDFRTSNGVGLPEKLKDCAVRQVFKQWILKISL